MRPRAKLWLSRCSISHDVARSDTQTLKSVLSAMEGYQVAVLAQVTPSAIRKMRALARSAGHGGFEPASRSSLPVPFPDCTSATLTVPWTTGVAAPLPCCQTTPAGRPIDASPAVSPSIPKLTGPSVASSHG